MRGDRRNVVVKVEQAQSTAESAQAFVRTRYAAMVLEKNARLRREDENHIL